jgi:hypothetical protein
MARYYIYDSYTDSVAEFAKFNPGIDYRKQMGGDMLKPYRSPNVRPVNPNKAVNDQVSRLGKARKSIAGLLAKKGVKAGLLGAGALGALSAGGYGAYKLVNRKSKTTR